MELATKLACRACGAGAGAGAGDPERDMGGAEQLHSLLEVEEELDIL